MCEQFVARAAEPFRLDELWDFADRLERFGIAGFGWGAAWIRPRRGSGATATSAPSAMTRPARASAGTRPRRPWSTFDDRRSCPRSARPIPSRSTTRPAGTASATTATCCSIVTGDRGTAARVGSAVGPTRRSAPAGSRTSGGKANWCRTSSGRFTTRSAARQPRRPDGRRRGASLRRQSREPGLHVPARRIGIAGTAIYSLDRSVFRFVAPGATDRRIVPIRTTASLDREGRPIAS